MLKKFRKKTTRKKIFITIGIAIIAVVMAIAGILSKREITKENTFTPDSELARAMTYDQFKDSDADISGTDYVKFGAFFLRDVNNDGYAEKIKGTCKKIGAEDTLYMELNILTNGYLEDGVITINSDNFYLQTAIPKDNEVKENAFSNNTKQISLNKINNGSQKLLTGIIRSGDYTYESKKYEAIGDDTSKYSKVNSITLTGTHVADDGTKTKISKTIKLNMDWYGSVKSEMPDNIAGSQNLNQSRENTNIVDETNNRAILEFNIGTQEVNNELILSKVCVEGTLPQLNGYNPSKVEVKNQNASINYDEETRKFTIKKSAELNSDNIVNTQCYDGIYGNIRYNKFNLKVTYPLEAYVATGGDAVEIKIPVTSYYEGYNNNNYEFKDLHKSNVSSGTIVVTYSRPSGDYARFDLTVGKYMGYPKYTYVISKKNPLKIYNEISAEENNDTYITKWYAVTGRNGDTDGLIMKETETGKNQVSDEFIKADSSTESMENITSNIGIYFSNPVNLLGKDGSIKVYDDETGELLHEFTNSDWNRYSESNPYKYEVPVKHIRVETSATQPNYSMSVYNVKKLDDAYITTNYTREEFDNLKYIKSTLSGYVGENHVNTDTRTARYEEQYSMADIKLSKTAISTQETEKNMQITISILGEENLNQKKWKNGIFLVKLPKDLIDIDISSVVSNNSAVDISSFETLEKDGNKFIKIITSNENPFLYAITINCDMTADPRILTNTESFELYAYNEDEVDYYNPVEDIYDINGNENTNEKINKSSINISFVSPNSFLTNESATDFDENGSVAVAPQIAVLDKERKNATVNIEINNNYSSNVNEVKILGRVPFEGNKYAINGEDMGSTFTATMTNEGINLPDKLKSVAKIYYSENGEATKDLDDSNAWTETPNDFSKVKSYLIDFGDYKFAKDEKYKISYNIEIPENLEYNKIAYSHHAIYFSLNTAEGKYKTQVEPNKIGFMITKQFELELTKYQKDKDIKVKGATYAIIEDGQGSSKTRGTDKDGKFTMSGLYVNKTYTVREVKSPNEYELNDEIVKFTTSENDGVLSVIINEGNARAIRAIQPTENDGYKVQLELEDELRGKLQITKFEKNTENKIPGVKYKLTGNNKEAILTTNTDGQTSISGLKIGEEYTLEEIKADGYYLSENPVKFKISNTDGAYSAKVTEGTTKKSEFVEEEWPTLKLELEDEKKPLYNLEISKIQKVTTSEATEDEKVSADEILSSTETVYLSGAKFKLFKGTQELGNYVTDDNGKITIRNLYQYIDGKNEEAVYTLKEMLPPVGYVKAKDISFKVDGSTGELVFINTDGVDEKYTTDGNTVKLLIEDNQVFKLVKRDAETQELLANIKFAIYNIDNGSTPAKNSKGEILGTKEVIDGKEYNTITTNDKGELTADLPEGMYKALEVEAPEKYDISKAYYFGIGTATEPSTLMKSVWGRSLGTDSGSEIKDVINTSDNGFIAVGNYSSQKEIDLGNNQSLPVSEGYDAMMIKYNLDSVVEWTKVISGTNSESIEKIFETSDGGYIVGGYFQSTANFGNGITLTSNGSKDALIVKYTSEGNVEWAKSFGGTAEDSISAVSETSDGGYIVGGYFKSSSVDLESGVTLNNKNNDETKDGIIVKYNNKGTIEWAKVIGGTKDDEVQSVAVTLEGNIIVGGNFKSMKVELEDEFSMTNPISDATSTTNSMLIKYSNDGSIGWTRIIPATRNYESNSINTIIKSKDGGFIIGGGSSGLPINMGNGIIIENTYGYRGIFAKYNDDGECEWANVCGLGDTTNVYSIVETTDGGYLIGGYFYSYSLDFGNGVSLSTNAGCDGMIVKYSSNGECEWAKGIGGLDYDYAYSAIELSNGRCLAAGSFKKHTIYMENGVQLTYGAKNEEGFIVEFEKNEISSNVLTYGGKVIGGESQDKINKMISTSDGGYLVGGYFYSKSIDLGNNIILKNTDNHQCGMIIKYNSNDEAEWAKVIGDFNTQVNTLVQLSDNSYIIGAVSSSYRFDLGDGVRVDTENNKKAGIIIKYDSNGRCEWAKAISGNGDNDVCTIAETTDGEFVVGGTFQSDVITFENGTQIKNNCNRSYDSNIFLVKYNRDGKEDWVKQVSSTSNLNMYSMDDTGDGGIIFTGRFYAKELKFENGLTVARTGGSSGAMIVKYNSNGEAEWVRTVSKDQGGFVVSVLSTSDGGYIVGGDFQADVTFDPGNGDISICRGNTDFLVIKYNAEGEIEWAKCAGGQGSDIIRSVIEVSDGYIVGGLMGSLGINLTDGKSIVREKQGMHGAIIKYDLEGNCQWAKSVSPEVQSIIQLSNGDIMAGGHISDKKAYTDRDEIDTDDSYNGMIIKLTSFDGLNDVEELKVENERKEFKIRTSVKDVLGTKGGSISGENEKVYETIKYGDSATKEIKIIPNENYEIIGIIINNEEYKFTKNEDGSYVMPMFTNVTEDKNIVVTFGLKDNKITINKVDKDTNEKISGAKFKIEAIDDTIRPSSDEILGELTDNGREYINSSATSSEITDKLGILTNNGNYYFVKNSDGTYTPTNSKTYQKAHEGTSGIKNSVASSYIPIDLTGMSGEYEVRVNASCSSEDNYDIGYATVTESTTAPTYTSSTGQFIKISGTQASNEHISNTLTGGKKYYLHLGYRKDSSKDLNNDQIVINSIKLYSKGTPKITYNFKNDNGKYVSTNVNKSNTVANSYIPIDLTKCTGNYKLIINAEISSNYSDYGYATIRESTTRPEYNDYTNQIIRISGTESARDYSTILQAGKMYYLHLGYYKSNSTTPSYVKDIFTINSVNISYDNSDAYSSTFETNADGQIITQLPFGKYNITEVKAPDGYILDSTTKAINFSSDDATAHEITIKNEKKAQVIVHHYKKGTTEKIADDEALEGKAGDEYTTNAKLDIAKYELEKDENNEIILPTNAHGLYEREPIEVTYYYIERKIPLTIHHYIEGTTTGVPLKNGGKAEDIIESGNEGDSYVTSPIDEVELDDRYELVEMPINANGTYTGNEVIVTYYYKKFSKEISLVKQNEEGEKLQGVKFEIKNTEQKDESGIKLDELQNNGEYYFENRAGKLVSNNKGVPDSTASSYLKIDLRKAKKNVKLAVNYEISSDWSDYGYIALTSSSDTPSKNDSSRKLTVTCGSNSATDATADLPMGSVYYLHFAYQKDSTKDANDDNFIINEITLDGNDYAKYLKNIQITDNEGKIENTLEAGTYEITEVEALDGYQLPENPTFELNITKETSEGAINIINEKKKGKVTVHHYLKDSTKSITLDDGSVAEDEIKIGNVGDRYVSKPKDLASAYTLVNNPENSYGTYTEENIEVTYYYEPKKVNVNINKIDDEGKAVEGAEFKLTNKMPEQNAVIDNGPGYPIVGEIGDKAGIKEELLTMAQYYQEKNQYFGQEFAPMEEKDGEYKTTKIIDSNNSVMMSAGVFKYDLTNYTQNVVLNMTIEYKNGGNTIYLIKPDKQQTIDSIGYYVGTKDYSFELEGGSIYYIQCVHVHLGDKDDDEYVKFKNIDLYRYKQKYYGFEKNDNEEYVSNNSEVPNTVAQSYVPIDMTNYYGKFNLNVDFSIINSNDANQGAVKLYDDKNNVISTMSEVSGNVDSEKCTAILAGGNNYKLEFAYRKNDESTDTKDVMRINNIQIDPNVDLTGETDENGNLQFEVVPGEYELSETKVPDGYDPPENIKQNVTVTADGADVTVVNHKHKGTITVHHYIEGTTTPIPLKNGENAQDDVIEGYVGNPYSAETIKETDTVYRVSNNPDNATGEFIDGNIEITYYYVLMDSKVIVHYYEENTTNKVSKDVEITGKIYDKYTTKSAEDVLSKYELVAEPQNKSGVMAEDTIEVIYYYRVKDAVVNVRYLEKGTNIELADADRIDGKVDENYETTAKDIEGYQLVEHTGNEKGKFEVEPITITYYYLYKTKATVQYIDKISGKILEQSTTEGLEGDEFVTESKNFENYILVEEPAKKTVKMTKEEQVLKYYYIHVSGGVIEKHIDVISGQILANAVHEGNEGDEYDIPSRTFEGYDLVEEKLPTNAKGTMKVEPVEVIYYYIYKTKVTAEYVDKNTGNKLAEDEVQNGHEGDNYITERKTFDDYKLVEVPANADGSMTKEDIKVTYYYVHTSGGVIVNHIDIKTGKQLLDETKEEGYEGDPYETHEENISGYDLVKDKYPENATGKMTIDPTRVTYYYIKKTEVNIKYVDKETGEEIDVPGNIQGHEGDEYKTEPKDVPGYDLVEEPENKAGTMTAEPIDVIYYYRRPAKVIVNYYDADTKAKLADEVEITGHQNDEYTTEQKDIKYYEIKEVPENKDGKMIVTVTKDENGKEIVEDTIYVNYYYRKLTFNLKVDKTIASVIVNGQETTINGNLGKVEVHRKELSTANVKVVYRMRVTNDGELTGKANVVENIPSGMTMKLDNNPGWTINETTASIETDEIKPGESREYQVVLGWQNGDSNVGTKENVASIVTENEAGFEEKNTADNESKADLIVAVGTGEVPYVAIAGGILMIIISITAGSYVINKKRK